MFPVISLWTGKPLPGSKCNSCTHTCSRFSKYPAPSGLVCKLPPLSFFSCTGYLTKMLHAPFFKNEWLPLISSPRSFRGVYSRTCRTAPSSGDGSIFSLPLHSPVMFFLCLRFYSKPTMFRFPFSLRTSFNYGLKEDSDSFGHSTPPPTMFGVGSLLRNS